jgi:uncharacterized protein (DUF488 family)
LEGRETGRIVYTVGHSSREFQELLEILRAYNVKVLVDVRRFPKSRRVPWTESSRLKELLEREGVSYVWLGDLLGGFRSGGYKRYMETEDYRRGLEKLVDIIEGSGGPVAIMCRERLWFKCHRRFISDSLTQLGYKVVHIIEKGKTYVHKGGGAAGI